MSICLAVSSTLLAEEEACPNHTERTESGFIDLTLIQTAPHSETISTSRRAFFPAF